MEPKKLGLCIWESNMKKVVARANSNIALVKYWGKKDEKLIIPQNSSVSMTLDALYTITEVEFTDERDIYFLDGELQDDKEHAKISEYIDIFRKKSKIFKYVKVNSINYVPTSAGLASSASGYAALAMALNKLFGLNYDMENVSKMARLGSGSASRSIFGGFVEWKRGVDHDTSFSHKICDNDWDISMIVIIINAKKKEISSRDGMKRTVETSPYYNAWIDSAERDVISIKEAINERDFQKMGEIAELSAMKMHATMMSANPPIIYFKSDSIKAIELVKKIRKAGIPCYYTMDAGPNVKVICESKNADIIADEFRKYIKNDIIISKIGTDSEILEEIK